MIVTIGGALGSGKSVVSKMVAKNMNLSNFSNGDFMRDIAKEHKMTLMALQKIAEKDKWVDHELDLRLKRLGENSDNFVVDARLGWHFIPASIKIFLDVSEEQAAKRIWNDKDNKRKNEGFKTFKDLEKELIERKASELKRYKKYYKINHHLKSNYDFILDTTELSIEQVVKTIVEFINEKA